MRISDWSSDVCSSDLTDHVEGRFGKMVIFAVDHRLERLHRVFDRHELAGDVGEDFGDVERLAEEALDLARTRDDQLIFFAELVHAENRDDVLKRLILLQRLDRKSTRLNSSH